ncbi:MAG: NADP-dependent malic enzyme [Minisyncoccia bacterium]
MKKKINKKSVEILALEFHKKNRGKIEIKPKTKLTQEVLRLAYTPGVAAVSSHVAKNKADTNTYTWRGNTVAVVSDGSAVLGLGNIGPEGALPVMEGKSYLFKALANVDAVPVVLGTHDTEEIIATIKNIAPSFAGINLEDIAAPRCFEIEKRLKEMLDIPVMHDDQHGTAMVVLAGLINALKVVKKKKESVKVVVAGAGAAGAAITEMLLGYGIHDVLVVDSKGVLALSDITLTGYKKSLAERTNKHLVVGTLIDALLGADVFIGVSKGNTVTAEMIQLMNKNAIVFAMANPIPEIMPEEAKRGGAVVIATGRSDFPNQVNNSLGFPGIFRGALDNKVRNITDSMLVRAAEALAKLVAKPTAKQILPKTFDPRVAKAVAKAIK